MSGAFAGVRIVDCAEGVAGPYTAMLLAEQGAEALRVESVAGDRLRGERGYYVFNRSKRTLTLDLDTGAGRSALLGLLDNADVWLHDWTTDRIAARGMDAATLHARNPDLLIADLEMYGERGPYAGLPPDETLLAAITGLLDAQWSWREGPVHLTIPIAAYGQAMVAVSAIGATLLARARGTPPERLRVSGLDGALAVQTGSYVQAAGVVRLAGSAPPVGGLPSYRLFKASDDWLFVGALTPAFWTSLALALGLEDLLADPRLASAPMAIMDADARTEMHQRIAAVIATRPRQRWLDLLAEVDVPRAPVNSRDDYLTDAQVRHNAMRIELDDPDLGPTVQMGNPVRLHATPGPAPRPREVGGPPSWPSSRPDSAFRPGSHGVFDIPHSAFRAPLAGVRVLDLTTFIAGANGPMLLADLGADVIKVEPPGGDPWRGFGLAFLGANRGKRSLAVELKRAEGRELFYELVRGMDIVADNFRAGVLERLGLDRTTLLRYNPRLITSSVTGYGPDGPYAHLPGFDPLMQARSGLMRAQGGAGDPVYLQVAVCDYATALMSAFGMIAALYARERTGIGQQVDTCLVNNAFTIQAGELLRCDRWPGDAAGGTDLLGVCALYRAYPCADGWLYLAARTPEHSRAIGDVLAISLPPDALDAPLVGDVAERIGAALASLTVAAAFARLRSAGVPCAPCTRVTDVFTDPHLVANGQWWQADHPVFGPLTQTGATARWDHMQMALDRRAPLLGEHTREALRAAGVGDGRIDALTGLGIVKT